ncbi:hypothetical protein OG921_15985 [Aldersonia sp. NBC_00410]|uniref:hypothetical protein n=1 Tax=Aldersonia sp. NBC_00410 TaxID=2975954 RepID=UPI0022566417|nr:hypothetical protein [Aldersonia sp. NBC_00410]MCX5044667.1 hypothetical protein [Aldersonia sp. NBC_00410]
MSNTDLNRETRIVRAEPERIAVRIVRAEPEPVVHQSVRIVRVDPERVEHAMRVAEKHHLTVRPFTGSLGPYALLQGHIFVAQGLSLEELEEELHSRTGESLA